MAQCCMYIDSHDLGKPNIRYLVAQKEPVVPSVEVVKNLENLNINTNKCTHLHVQTIDDKLQIFLEE